MDQKSIDALITEGSDEDSSVHSSPEKDDIFQEIIGKAAPVDARKSGHVMGQISTVTEESEKGTNMVMGFLENVLTTLSEQKSFIEGVAQQYKKGSIQIDWSMVCSHLNDISSLVEEEIYGAMDAFQFQDIGRQKLMKVMYTLGKLNDYLNELLGHADPKDRHFGKQIEKKTLEKDKDKNNVDALIEQFRLGNK